MYRYITFLKILTLIFLNLTPVYSGKVVFSKENIAVTILPPCSIQVRGEYFFTSTNKTPSFSNLFYPFPLDSTSLYPYSINVTDMKSFRSLSFTKNDKGILFSIEIKPRDTTGILVIYRQVVKNQRGTYILTTTANWGRPLYNSSYSVRIHTGLTLDYLSYACDSVSVIGDTMIYNFFRKQFMPDRDLFFTWSK